MLVIRKNKYQELENLRKRTNLIRLFEGILIGAAIGLMIGMLFAPKDGEGNRTYLAGKASSLRSKCRSLWSNCCGWSCCGGECDSEAVNEDPLDNFNDD